MPYYCTVPRCTSMAGKAKNVSFHQFPRDEELAKLWNKILKRGKPYTKYSKVCSLHFTQEDYTITSVGKNKGQWRTLRKDAIPSQNLPSESPTPYQRKQWSSWSREPPHNILDPTIQQQMAQAIYMQTMLAMQVAGSTDMTTNHANSPLSIPTGVAHTSTTPDTDILKGKQTNLHTPNSYKCTECSKCFKDPDVFILHKRTHIKHEKNEKENFNLNLTLQANPILANLLKTNANNPNIFDTNFSVENILMTALAANMEGYMRNFSSIIKNEGRNHLGDGNNHLDDANNHLNDDNHLDDANNHLNDDNHSDDANNHLNDDNHLDDGDVERDVIDCDRDNLDSDRGLLDRDRDILNHRSDFNQNKCKLDRNGVKNDQGIDKNEDNLNHDMDLDHATNSDQDLSNDSVKDNHFQNLQSTSKTLNNGGLIGGNGLTNRDLINGRIIEYYKNITSAYDSNSKRIEKSVNGHGSPKEMDGHTFLKNDRNILHKNLCDSLIGHGKGIQFRDRSVVGDDRGVTDDRGVVKDDRDEIDDDRDDHLDDVTNDSQSSNDEQICDKGLNESIDSNNLVIDETA